MKLYLVQHGLSFSKEQDSQRSLTIEGEQQVEKTASYLRDKNILVNQVIHSGKTRAMQTAEIFEKYLEPEKGSIKKEGLNPDDDVIKLAGYLENRDRVMIVGHLPFLNKLLSFLLTGSTDRNIFKFQNAGVVCLEKNKENNFYYIKWTVLPVIE